MLEEGFIRLYRSITKWEWYDDISTFRLFVHLLLTVNYYDNEWRGITVKRSQRICSYAALAAETKLSVQNVRTAIKHLISTGEVTYRSYPKFGLITINNYNKYQSLTDSQQTANIPLTDFQQASNNKVRKLIKQEDKKNICTEQQQPLRTETPIITLTLNDKSEYPIYEHQVSQWAEAYPAVSVVNELHRMKVWLDANPTRRKTKSGILRFVNAWLSRAQDKGGYPAEEEPPAYEYIEPKPEDDEPYLRDIPENATLADILPPATEVISW